MPKQQPEWALSHWVDRFLDRALLTPCYFTAVETAFYNHSLTPQQRMLVNQRRAARGIKPHHLDFYVYQAPYYCQIELKVNANEATAGQIETAAYLNRMCIPNTVVRSVVEVGEFLVSVGYKLHGNWRNIAAEYDARFEVGRVVVKPTAKRASKPRATKPSQARLKAVAGVRERVLF